MKQWENAKDVFKLLNDNFNYLVIRNHEGFYDSVISEAHEDIDLLCQKKDKRKIIELLNAKPRLDRDDKIHYYILINGNKISVDLRSVGDGYYDENWQRVMLQNRVMDERGFYRMDDNNYFWSLLYHSLYHKGKISNEYFSRLKQLNKDYFSHNQSKMKENLDKFLLCNGYYYTKSRDRYLWYYYDSVPKKRIKTYKFYYVNRFFLHVTDFFVNKFNRRK